MYASSVDVLLPKINSGNGQVIERFAHKLKINNNMDKFLNAIEKRAKS